MATIPQKTIDARPGWPLSADEREAVMIGSFRFEGGAQKTLEHTNLFANVSFPQIESNSRLSSRLQIAPEPSGTIATTFLSC
jgi:hypothetical protein